MLAKKNNPFVLNVIIIFIHIHNNNCNKLRIINNKNIPPLGGKINRISFNKKTEHYKKTAKQTNILRY